MQLEFKEMKELEKNIDILKTSKFQIPFDSIEYLQHHTNSNRITDEIIKSVNKSIKNQFLLGSEHDVYDCTPLSFLIVAEYHLSLPMVNFLIQLCGNNKLEWDLLNEQINFLVSKSCHSLEANVSHFYFDQIYKCVLNGSNSHYLFLSESFFFLDKSLHLKKLNEILDSDQCYWYAALVHFSGDTGFTELIPKLKNIKDFAKNNMNFELEQAASEAIDNLNNESEILNNSYYKIRKNWKAFYKNINSNLDQLLRKEEDFYFESEFIEHTKPIKSNKLGRNDKCSCGSGLKYKKCCLPLLN